eukprot:gene2485-18858_t
MEYDVGRLLASDMTPVSWWFRLLRAQPLSDLPVVVNFFE